MIGTEPEDAGLSGERYARIWSSAYNPGYRSSGERPRLLVVRKALHKDLVVSKSLSLLHPTIFPVITDYTRFTTLIFTLFNSYNRTHSSSSTQPVYFQKSTNPPNLSKCVPLPLSLPSQLVPLPIMPKETTPSSTPLRCSLPIPPTALLPPLSSTAPKPTP